MSPSTPPRAPDLERTITLDFPITINGAKVGTLTARRLKVKERFAVDEATEGMSDVVKEGHLMAMMVGLAPEDIQEMDLADYNKITSAFRDFLGGGTAKTSAK